MVVLKKAYDPAEQVFFVAETRGIRTFAASYRGGQ